MCSAWGRDAIHFWDRAAPNTREVGWKRLAGLASAVWNPDCTGSVRSCVQKYSDRADG